MSADNENNIKVSINKEYDRILSNPDGLIMSEGLADRLESAWDLAGALKTLENNPQASTESGDTISDEDYQPQPSTMSEKNSIRVFSKDKENIGLVYGEVQSFTSLGDDYSIGILVRGDHRRFMGTLMHVQQGECSIEEFGFDVAGRNGFIALGVEVSSWSFTKINSYDTTLTINFGSQHVEF